MVKSSFVRYLSILGIALLCLQSTQAQQQAGSEEKTVKVGAQTFHYLIAGSGAKTVVLLHGWPESSAMWKQVLPSLAAGDQFTVIAPDLRGINGTSAPDEKYDKATMARDIHTLIAHLELKNVVLIGHDIGGMVAYAYARLYPKELRGVALLDIPVPGVDPWDAIKNSGNAWHFAFHNQEPLTENLVKERQATYFRYFMNKVAAIDSAITDEVVEAHVKAYDSDESLHAGFEWYRAFAEDEKFNKSHRELLPVPMLLVGADSSMNAAMMQGIAKNLKPFGVRNISIRIVPRSGHYMAEENPAATTTIIHEFAKKVTGNSLSASVK